MKIKASDICSLIGPGGTVWWTKGHQKILCYSPFKGDEKEKNEKISISIKKSLQCGEDDIGQPAEGEGEGVDHRHLEGDCLDRVTGWPLFFLA